MNLPIVPYISSKVDVMYERSHLPRPQSSLSARRGIRARGIDEERETRGRGKRETTGYESAATQFVWAPVVKKIKGARRAISLIQKYITL